MFATAIGYELPVAPLDNPGWAPLDWTLASVLSDIGIRAITSHRSSG